MVQDVKEFPSNTVLLASIANALGCKVKLGRPKQGNLDELLALFPGGEIRLGN